MILTVTKEAREYLDVVTKLQRRILILLFDGKETLLNLVKRLRQIDEYKYVDMKYVSKALAVLMNLKCITYSGDYE